MSGGHYLSDFKWLRVIVDPGLENKPNAERYAGVNEVRVSPAQFKLLNSTSEQERRMMDKLMFVVLCPDCKTDTVTDSNTDSKCTTCGRDFSPGHRRKK